MRTGLFDRRTFLKAAGASFVAGLSPLSMARAESADALFATAYQEHGGQFGVAIMTESGKLVKTLPLPDRGHDVTFDPVSRRSVIFARQPGTFAMVFDHQSQSEPVTIASADGRHFYGHGVFSPDGKLLYATENDYDNAAGIVGIYDATDGFRRTGEFPTYGVGPHELLLCLDGVTLAVANGGIETHPDFGRAKLNIATMKPSLVFIDRRDGALLERHEPAADLHQLSIRHMDFDQTGAIWFGCQFEGPTGATPALVGRARRGETFELLDMPAPVLSGLRNYVGSVATNPNAGTVAVTSPQGNSLVVIDTVTKTVVATQSLIEVCGIASDGPGFLASTGAGDLVMPTRERHTEPDYVWDNHLLRIG